jgi:hypothetical protein
MRSKALAVPDSTAHTTPFALGVRIFLFLAVKQWSLVEPI